MTAPAPGAPLRVRVVHTRYPHFGAHAGMFQFARHLDPAHVEAALAPVSDSDEDFPLRHAALRARLRARVARQGIAWYKLSDLWAECTALGAALARRADVVHFIDGEHSPGYLPRLLRRARVLGTRTVATFHQPPEMLDELLSRDVVQALDLVTVVSPTQADWFRALLPASRVEVVLHGVDTAFFTPAPPRPAAPGAPFRCITVGHWLRDHAAVRAVAALLADEAFEFHVVTARDLGLDDLPNVVRHRDVSDEALRDLYRSCDAAFLPLTASTANNALLESIACGLPVVATALPAVRAYLPGDEALLVPDNDPARLAAALRTLRDAPDRRAAMARDARARAESLAWPRVAARFAALYARVAGAPHAGVGRDGERTSRDA